MPTETHPGIYALTKYWDVPTLRWVKGTQPSGGGGGGGAVTVADGADVTEGSTTDAAVTTDANGTISAKLRGLVTWFTRITQLNNTIPNPLYSLQLGGADTDGGTHRHIGASNSEVGATAVGLFVRNISGMGTPGSAVIGQVNVVAGRDPNTNVVRQVEVMVAAPAGTEGGVVTRNIAIVAGAGAVTALTPRTTLASDDPAVASLGIMDDWDETDRCKVNIIAGQVGVQGGLGLVTALTQRTIESRSDTSVVTSQLTSAVSVTLKAANASRLGLTIFNRCSTQSLYVKCGTTASITDFTVLILPNQYWEMPFNHTGRVDGIWAVADPGSALVTEFS